MNIYLAPMEGVVDSVIRHLLTSIGGFDYCVTEFIRVTSMVYPNNVFFRYCPELKNHAKTATGVPVLVQFLGSDALCIGANAMRAVQLGASGVDLNFGCPAKTVNRNDGGATLLKNPDRVYNVVSGVRNSVVSHIPVSAKIRLGYDDKSLALENALAAEEGGASILIVHARTKKEGYRPPAHWEWIAKIRENLKIPVVANGDIWCLEDYIRCRNITGCDDVMIGRGALSMPDLALQIKSYLSSTTTKPYSWDKVLSVVTQMYVSCWNHDTKGQYPMCRLKQWLKMLMRNYEEAKELFQVVKISQDPKFIYSVLQQTQNHLMTQ